MDGADEDHPLQRQGRYEVQHRKAADGPVPAVRSKVRKDPRVRDGLILISVEIVALVDDGKGLGV